MFCEVIVDIKNNQMNKTFEYIVPAEFEEVIEIGHRVKVVFGKRLVAAYVVKIKQSVDYPVHKLKPISEILEITPSLNQEFIDLAFYMADKYYSFYVDCLDVMIPSAKRVTYHKKLKLLSDDKLSLALVQEFKNGDIYLDSKLLSFSNEIKRALKNNSILMYDEIKERGKTKKERVIELVDDSIKVNGHKAQKLLQYLVEMKADVKESIVVKDMGFSKQVIKTLEKKNIIKIKENEIYRDVRSLTPALNKVVELNEEQNKVLFEIKNSVEENVYLLHGVTGSGKTEIYLQLIEEVLEKNQQAIMLVPEISLTPQMVSRFKGRFQNLVAVLHSGLTMGERFDEWRRIQALEAKIVIGARSAIFAPFNNLGIIIIDEEHEGSYKQDTSPKYDAIDIAIRRGKTHHCKVVLGSATPSVCSYYKALNKEYTLLELKSRANRMQLPTTTIVDMTTELKKGNRSVFSFDLQRMLKERFINGEQSILFLNRRGHSSFVMCRECGETIKCPHCDVSLTYHKSNNRLKCHYCGYEMPNVNLCPSCGSHHIRFVGGGTQKIEETINELIPEAKVVRMDYDTTNIKNGHEILLEKFRKKEADILIGTQMISKGLDFENVTLVGILNADMALKFPVYDANEICFQLIEQVAGRCGRGSKPGEVIIQTYNPNHFSIVTAQKHQYREFYNQEIKFRESAFNPPFSELVEIVISSKDASYAYDESNKLVKFIKSKVQNSIVYGPVEAIIFKMNERFRFSVTIKFKKEELTDVFNYINEEYQNRPNIMLNITRIS